MQESWDIQRLISDVHSSNEIWEGGNHMMFSRDRKTGKGKKKSTIQKFTIFVVKTKLVIAR